MLNLGPRLSEQEYSSDDRKLLDNLAAQAAPALRVGQLVREQQAEARHAPAHRAGARGRPADPAELPAQASFPSCPAGRSRPTTGRRARSAATSTTSSRCPTASVGFVVGDVTDKGVPAALVMAATRSVLRASAQRLIEPGEVLERVNEHLCPDMPEKMFVTCLYGVLDPATGRFRFANAGHDLPVRQDRRRRRSSCAPAACRSGLMPGMAYEEKETVLAARRLRCCCTPTASSRRTTPTREMFGFPRLKQTRGRRPGGGELIDRVLSDLEAFTGPDAEQEDDITMVTLAALGARRWPRRRGRRRAARRVRGPERAGQRARGDRARGAPRSPASASTERAARAAQDRGRRGDDERDGARQRVPRRPPGRRSACSPADGRVRVQITDRGGAPAESASRETPDLEAEARGPAAPARLGPVPDREHGRRDARDERRGARTPSSSSCAWKEATMATSELPRPCAARRGRRDRPRGRRRPRRRGGARGGLDAGRAERPTRWSSTSRAPATSTRTGIALIVGLLARARAAGIEVRRLRTLTHHYREIFEILHPQLHALQRSRPPTPPTPCPQLRAARTTSTRPASP